MKLATRAPTGAVVAAPVSVSEAAAPVRALSLLPLLVGLLVLTGAAGLIYQVVWFRVLGQIFGVTVHATSAVLAAFMAGLALGSLVAGRLADRLRRPLRAYGVMELCIGLSGFASLYAFDALQPLFRAVGQATEGAPAQLNAARFALAFAIMLVPTTLMGATLPMVLRSSLARESAVSRNVSLLYAFNTLGAIAGAYVAGFYLIGLFGTGGATLLAAILNLLVGAACLLLDRRIGTGADGGAERTHATNGAAGNGAPRLASRMEAALPPRAARVVLATYAISGGVALAYEVIWTRVLSLVLPQTVYAFALMLCAILSGIALGSWVMEAVIARRAPWLLVYAAFQAAMGTLGILSATVLGHAFGVEALARRLLATDRLLFGSELWFMTLFAFLTVFPAALIMGATFPVATRVYAAGHPDLGRRVGTIYGANVCGAIAGSLLAGLALIPLLGAQRTIWLLGGVNVALGLVAFSTAPLGWSVTRRVGAAAGAVVLAVAAAVVTPDMYRQLFGSQPRGEQVLWFQEGDDATIRVARATAGNLFLYVNSQGQATDAGTGVRFHWALGHLPALLHPSARQMLVVGLGGGATAGAVATHPGVEVTIAELHAGVVEGARLFSHVNFGVLDRPNVRVTVADGRNHLLLTRQTYDVIQGDIIPPGNAGAANLYSADYYRLARNALKPGGMMVQWADASLPEYQWKLLLRTFLSVFPDATLWGLNSSMIVGTQAPLRIDRPLLDARYQSLPPSVLDNLSLIQMGTPDELLKQFVARADELAAYVGPGPIITDRQPSIEYTRTLPGGDRASPERFSHDARAVLR